MGIFKSRRALRREIRDLHRESEILSRRERALTVECKRHLRDTEGLRQQVTSAARAADLAETITTMALRKRVDALHGENVKLASDLEAALGVVEARFEPDAEGWSVEDELRVVQRQNRELEQRLAESQAANESMETWRKQVAS